MSLPEFPGAWDLWPPLARQYLTDRVIRRMLEIHGPADLVKWAYAGQARYGTGVRVPFNGDVADFWSLLLEDAIVWRRAEVARRAALPSTEVP
jgi:hypothetical protein